MSGCGEHCGCGSGATGQRQEREHWRSLEELAGNDEAREFREREFPVGASELPEGIDRRELVHLLGASLSLAGMAACRRPVEHIVPFVEPPENLIPGVPKNYATTLTVGTAAYGVLVESHEGRPSKIEGNELHPASLGGASALLQASILGLYDPDRSAHVLARGVGAPPADAAAVVPAGDGEATAAPPAGVLANAERKTWGDFVTAWTALEAGYLSSGGTGLAILAPGSSSPTRERLAGELRRRLPNHLWATWDALGDGNALAGAALVAGRPLRPVLATAKAQVVVCLDADLLLGERDAIAQARGFAAGRQLVQETDEMNRLWVIESALTSTGAMADHRLAVASSRIGGLTVALAAALADAGVAVARPAVAAPTLDPNTSKFIAVLARDLAAHAGRSLVVAGREQPAAVHALVLLINAALGNLGTTVWLREPLDEREAAVDEVANLVAAIGRGEVSTLVVLGGNPAYDAPADLDLAGALARVPTVIHLGHETDETAALAHWHLPAAHELETWGDARSADGTASVCQPLIAPLFGGHSAIELLALLASGAEVSGYDAVRSTWRGLLGASSPVSAAAVGESTTAVATAAPAADQAAGGPVAAATVVADTAFDFAFAKVLHDGLQAPSALPPVAVTFASELPADATASLTAATSEGLELVFKPSAVWDGRFANLGWLQELPDAISKLTWGNAALFAPATASRLGISNEQGVRVRLAAGIGAAAAEVEIPAWIVPGQAEDTVVLPLGYGRRMAGRVAAGVGVDVYPLRRSTGLGFATGATVEASGQAHRLAQTQDHGSMEGRPIVREASLAEWRQHPRFAEEMVEMPAGKQLFPEHSYDQGQQWAMTIDLSLCTGCNACVVACQSENNVPIVGHEQVRRGREMHWLRLDRYYSGPPESPEVVFQPVPCMQCENAPCEQVCPVAATVHDHEGLNAMVYNRCIGTRYCSNNCPYKVRRFNFFNYTKDTPELLKMAANPEVTVRSRGVMEKCTYCTQRIQEARINAKMAERPLVDGDVRTACEQTCPTQAIVFGNGRDPGSRVHERKARSRNYILLAELGNKPRTSYLARIRNPHPELAPAPATVDHAAASAASHS